MRTIFTVEYMGREIEAVFYPDAEIVGFFYKDSKEEACKRFVLVGDWRKDTNKGVALKKPIWRALHDHVKTMIWAKEAFKED